MSKVKAIFDVVVLGIALGTAIVLNNTALAVGGIILVMLSDRLPKGQ